MTYTPSDFALLAVAIRIHEDQQRPDLDYSALRTLLFYNLPVILAALDIASGVKP